MLAALLVLTGAGVAVAVEYGPDRSPGDRTEATSASPTSASPGPAASHATTPTTAKAAAKPGVTRTRAVDDARTQIRRNGPAVRSAAGEKYRAVDAVVDPGGSRHVRFRRTHQGLAVLGGDFVVHSAANGQFVGASVAQKKAIDVPDRATVSRKRAIAVAEKRFSGRRTDTSARKVVDAFAGTPVLAWEVTVSGQTATGTPSALVVVVDATTGEVRRAYDEVRTAEAGTGHGLHVGDVPLSTTRRDDGTYTLVDPDRGGTTVRDAQNKRFTFRPETFAEFIDPDNNWGDGTRADRATAAVDVHYGMASTWDYLSKTFGRAGIGNDGKGVTAYVHHDIDANYAAWNKFCECLVFGDGTPQVKPYTPLDVVGHEMAHGLDDKTSNLVNLGESGGLSEANGDIFGTLVEFATNNPADPPDYLIGEKTERGSPAMRRMDEPSRIGESVSCWTPAAKDLDEHDSAGIGDKFFYTLAVGSGKSSWGDSPPCGDAAPVTGIGNDRAARIWYRALTVYMVSSTIYAGARDATLRAATDLYGADSLETRTVNAAWLAVGVDGSDPRYGAPEILPLPQPGFSTVARMGKPFSMQVSAKDHQGQAVTFTATNLPPGLSIDASGLIAGTPTTKGEYGGSVLATDPQGNVGTKDLFWLVKGPPVVTAITPARIMRVGGSDFGRFGVTFRDVPDYQEDPDKSLKVTATGLPAGLELSVTSRTDGTYVADIAGFATTAGSGKAEITATDADGDQVTEALPWQVLTARQPGEPRSVTSTVGNGTALVEWDMPELTTDTAWITGYVVRVSPGTETKLAPRIRSLRLDGLNVRQAYTIGVRATTSKGTGPEKTITLTPTTLAVTAAPTAVDHGKRVTLSGKVTRGGAAGAPGALMTLEQLPAGQRNWSRAATVKADAKGGWRHTVAPATTTAYRVKFAGSSGMWPATSATVTTTIRYAVTVTASTTRPKANKKIKITGTTKPGRAGVKVTLQRKSGSRWVTVTSAKTTASGKYSFSRAFKRGTWKLRTVVPGSAYNAGATSSTVKLKVK